MLWLIIAYSDGDDDGDDEDEEGEVDDDDGDDDLKNMRGDLVVISQVHQSF